MMGHLVLWLVTLLMMGHLVLWLVTLLMVGHLVLWLVTQRDGAFKKPIMRTFIGNTTLLTP
jgi:hypothetical protein